jgi:hypothetical protein
LEHKICHWLGHHIRQKKVLTSLGCFFLIDALIVEQNKYKIGLNWSLMFNLKHAAI